jgi:hypothetical protein
MPSDEGVLDRFVDWVPTTLVFKRVASWTLVPYWARRTPVKSLPGGPPRRPGTATMSSA